MIGKFIDLIQELRESQYNSQDPTIFEEVLVKTFCHLGFHAKHIGGRDSPDILIEDYKIVFDAKTAKKGVIGETYVNFNALKRYKNKYNAEHVGIIAPAFSGGNIQDTAKKEEVMLIETEAICNLLYNHNISPYTTGEIFDMLFKGGGFMVSSEDIKSSLGEPKKIMVEIIRDLFSILEKFREKLKKFTPEKLQEVFMYAMNKDYRKEDIKLALELLLRLNVLKTEDQQEYELTRDINEIFEDVNILCLARGIIEEPYKIKDEIIRPSESKIRTSERLPKSLEHILKVIEYMKQGMDYTEACSKVATEVKPKRVTPGTIASQCTRELSITAPEFRSLYKENKLEKFLREKFPDYIQSIGQVFNE